MLGPRRGPITSPRVDRIRLLRTSTPNLAPGPTSAILFAGSPFPGDVVLVTYGACFLQWVPPAGGLLPDDSSTTPGQASRQVSKVAEHCICRRCSRHSPAINDRSLEKEHVCFVDSSKHRITCGTHDSFPRSVISRRCQTQLITRERERALRRRLTFSKVDRPTARHNTQNSRRTLTNVCPSPLCPCRPLKCFPDLTSFGLHPHTPLSYLLPLLSSPMPMPMPMPTGINSLTSKINSISLRYAKAHNSQAHIVFEHHNARL